MRGGPAVGIRRVRSDELEADRGCCEERLLRSPCNAGTRVLTCGLMPLCAGRRMIRLVKECLLRQIYCFLGQDDVYCLHRRKRLWETKIVQIVGTRFWRVDKAAMRAFVGRACLAMLEQCAATCQILENEGEDWA